MALTYQPGAASIFALTINLCAADPLYIKTLPTSTFSYDPESLTIFLMVMSFLAEILHIIYKKFWSTFIPNNLAQL